MALPKQRHNKSRRDRRRAGHPKLAEKSLVACKNCGKMIMPHRLCTYCGEYGSKKETTNI